MLIQKLRLEFVFAAVMMIVVSGCSSESAIDLVKRANNSNIQKLSNLYIQYQADHDFVGPDSIETFRKYVENDVPDFIKERIELTSTDELFVSERDGQPFKIRLEVIGSARGCSEPAIFEAEGKDGKFLVGFLNMTTREVEKNEYEDLWAGKNAS